MSFHSHIPWSNKCYINMLNNGDPWTTKTKLQLFSSKSEIIKSFNLDENRGYLDGGIYPILDKELLLLCYLKYDENDKSSIFIDYYKIDDTDMKLIKQHKIRNENSCGGTEGRVFFYDELCYVVYGDLINNDYFSCVEFNFDHCFSDQKYKIKYESSYEPEFRQIYMISKNCILYSRSFGYNHNKIKVGLYSLNDSKCINMTTIDLENGLSHDADNEFKEFESIIYDIFTHKNITYVLIRIKLYYRVDILHIKRYFLDVIFNFVKMDVVDMSRVIYYDTEKDYDGYFGIRPYYVIKDDKVTVFN
jgi:hypothetical protein